MRVYRKIYVSPELEKKKNKILRKLKKGNFRMNLHIILLAGNERNQLEICHAGLFLQPDYPKKDYFVVGIAKGYDEAIELVEEITEEVYNKMKGADIRSFILKNEQEG